MQNILPGLQRAVGLFLVVGYLIATWGGSAYAQALAPERVMIPPPTKTAGIKPTALIGYLFKPASAGDTRVPIIVALHGCGGLFSSKGEFSKRALDWAGRWVEAGYAVVFPDSFGSRELGPQCGVKDRQIVPRHRADDANAVASWVATLPYADASRLALVGWSNGGSAVLSASRSDGHPVGVEFRTTIAFYPGCRGFETSPTWQPRLPLNIFIGASDDWTPAAPCRALQSRSNVRYVEYPGAYHGFDAPDSPVRVRKGLSSSVSGDGTAHVGTNPEARAAAIDAVAKILAAAFQ
jgi:dienelactone hydrolase